MYRQSSCRNQRNKGIKVKHALQICLLLAVCFWLIYQVKHSHDKKKEFDESDAKRSFHGGSSGGFIKHGRKDIHPRDWEQHDAAAEEEETTEEEVEENKHEEYRPEDKKVEGEDEGSRDEDDEADEHEVEKLDTEVDREEDSVNDEERQDGVENEIGGEIIDDGNGQMKKESSMEDAGHDEDDKNNHEPREELYKADDVSSAMTHENHKETAENANEGVRISVVHLGNFLERENKKNNSEETNNGEIREQLEVEGGEIAKDDNPSNVTFSETNVTASETKDTMDSLEKGLSPNNTLIKVSNDNLEPSNGTTEVITQNPKSSLHNVTGGVPEQAHGQGIVTKGTSTEGSNLQTIALEQGHNSTLDMENNLIDSNSTGHAESKNSESSIESFYNRSNDTESSMLGEFTRPEDSLEAGTNKSAIKNEETESARSDISDGTDDVLESATTKNPEEVLMHPVDLSDTSNSLDEKDVRMDLDTLPEIQTEGTNGEDAVAE